MNIPEPFPITNATDIAILMQRDAHFSGSFSHMLDYYREGNIGCSLEFTIEQVLALAEMEEKTGQNLSPLLLSGADAEKVARAKDSYKKLRELYEAKKPASQIPLLVADLILSENEDVSNEINALAAHGKAATPFLIDLIRSDDYHDPLFPGYGLAPERAARCLGKIGDKSAIVTLFASIHENEFFEEDVSLEALKKIGIPARDFLLTVVKSQPINIDNERAAIALIEFENDPIVADACFELLQKINLNQHLPLATYLVLACASLKDKTRQKAFIEMSKDSKTPSVLKQDMKVICSQWC